MKIPQLCEVGKSLSTWGLTTFIEHIESCEICCKVNLLQVTEPENNYKYINNVPIPKANKQQKIHSKQKKQRNNT